MSRRWYVSPLTPSRFNDERFDSILWEYIAIGAGALLALVVGWLILAVVL